MKNTAFGFSIYVISYIFFRVIVSQIWHETITISDARGGMGIEGGIFIMFISALISSCIWSIVYGKEFTQEEKIPFVMCALISSVFIDIAYLYIVKDTLITESMLMWILIGYSSLGGFLILFGLHWPNKLIISRNESISNK